METMYINPKILKVVGAAKKSAVTYAKTRSQSKLIDSLTKLGYKVLGRGAYSVVCTHEDPKKVVKITLSAVDGYHKYVEWVMQHSSVMHPRYRKHLPKVYETIVYKGGRVTVLEKLKSAYHYNVNTTYEQVDWLVCKVGQSFKLNDDSGGSNIMLRGKTIVITDPWSHL